MMEKLNLDFSNPHKTITSICWIFSVLSWLLLIITNLICYHWIKVYGTVWTIYRIPIVSFKFPPWKTTDNDMGHYPVQMQQYFIYIVFTVLLLFFISAFIAYMYKSIFKKDSAFFNEMFNPCSRFHFIPILCASALFLISETLGSGDRKDRQRNIAGLVIVIIGLISMIFIYIKTDLPGDWMCALVKKGAFSCLIALEWYYLCYDIVNVRINDEWEHTKTINTCGIVFSIIIAIGALSFSIFYKDVVVAGVNLIIHIGMIIFFFSIDSGFKKKMGYNTTFDGVVFIIMSILFLVDIAFLIIVHKDQCLK